MGGYDKRRYVNRRRSIGYKSNSSGQYTSYQVAHSVCSVTSWRSDPEGIPLLESAVDPYAWFIGQDSQRRRKAAVAARRQGSDQSWVVDNGHAFQLERHTIYPLAPSGSGRWWGNVSQASNYQSGGIMTTCNPRINLLSRGRMLFGYQNAAGEGYVTPLARAADWPHKYYGAKAISTLAPTRPKINLAVSIAEILREGVPGPLYGSTLKSLVDFNRRGGGSSLKLAPGDLKRLKPLKNASKDYVAFFFAIKPLLQDLEKLIEVAVTALDTLKQYERDAGKGVRRSMMISDVTRTAEFASSDLEQQAEVGVSRGHWPYSVGGTSSTADKIVGGITTRLTQQLREEIWFTGSFSYYLPIPLTTVGKMEKAVSDWKLLYGSPISWEALWELTPWSWFVDWFVDLQTLVSAAETYQDKNLVINYGYLMRRATCTTTIYSDVLPRFAKSGGVERVVTQYSSEFKERVRANPFGFEFKTPEALDGFQWSLLAAIGLSR